MAERSSASITIIGAGPVGSLLALMLARRGRRVQLIERRGDPRTAAPERGRSINLALAARGLRALEHARLLGAIAAEMVVMPGRMLHDEHGATSFLPYGQNEREVIYAISRERLNRLLVEAAAKQTSIELRFALRCIDVDVDACAIVVKDERTGRESRERFELLFGADGAGSAVRAALFARGLTQAREAPLAHDYKELLIPATPRAAFEPHALHIWPRGDFMLIALPNADQSFTATLFLPRHGAVSFDALHSDGGARMFFAQHFADAAAAMPQLEQEFRQHPQGRLATLYCERWQAGGRVLLLGDAAHAIVPFHGQGLNCGFEDCILLDELLAAHTDAAAAFTAFEQRRRPDTDAIAAMAIENYYEMRAAVRAPDFLRRKALAAQLEQRFPRRFIQRYSMVMFHPEIPYSQAQSRGLLQERVLDALTAQLPAHALAHSAVELPAQAQQLLDEAGL
ncbi:MAG: FAD-dependent oxidoreductase [Steroidobacterales bacterium]